MHFLLLPHIFPPSFPSLISGLKVEGVYRRCGVATKVRQLVEALCASPGSAPLETDEQGVLDAAAALKMYVRQQEALIPPQHAQLWVEAAGEAGGRGRLGKGGWEAGGGGWVEGGEVRGPPSLYLTTLPVCVCVCVCVCS